MAQQRVTRETGFRVLSNIRKTWRALGVIVLNTIVLLAILNGGLWVAFAIRDRRPEPAFEIPIRKRYPEVDLTRVYPGYSEEEIDSLLTEEWARTHMYAALTQHRHRPQTGRYVNIAPKGFRLVGPSRPTWPPPDDQTTVFVFGGSTTFGVGIADADAIPAQLEELLRAAVGQDVTVYNFGQGYYYSSQERVLFAELLSDGFVPDMAIFIDGLNDLGMREPPFTTRLTKFMDGDVAAPRRAVWPRRIPMVRAALGIKHRLFPSAPVAAMGPQSPEPARVSPDVWNARALNRYRSNQRMILASARSFGVEALFVWQPIPTYRYDRANHLFTNSQTAEDIGRGYEAWAAVRDTRENDSTFLWLADMQEALREPLYVDGVHYTAKFSRRIAEAISRRVLGRTPFVEMLRDPL